MHRGRIKQGPKPKAPHMKRRLGILSLSFFQLLTCLTETDRTSRNYQTASTTSPMTKKEYVHVHPVLSFSIHALQSTPS